MSDSHEIRASLKREYDLCSNAMAFYQKALRELEHKHNLSTKTFLKKFYAGLLGDEVAYFDWYAYAKLRDQANKTPSAIRSAIP